MTHIVTGYPSQDLEAVFDYLIRYKKNWIKLLNAESSEFLRQYHHLEAEVLYVTTNDPKKKSGDEWYASWWATKPGIELKVINGKEWLDAL
jgi:hypothetical protein